MSAFINEITVMGNLGRDPELRFFANGTPTLRVSMATQEPTINKDTGEVVETTQWHTASLIGNQAEIVAKYMKKGDKLWVRGPLQTKIYEDERSGQSRLSVLIKVQDMKMIHTRTRHDVQSQGLPAQQAEPSAAQDPVQQPALTQENPLDQFS